MIITDYFGHGNIQNTTEGKSTHTVSLYRVIGIVHLCFMLIFLEFPQHRFSLCLFLCKITIRITQQTLHKVDIAHIGHCKWWTLDRGIVVQNSHRTFVYTMATHDNGPKCHDSLLRQDINQYFYIQALYWIYRQAGYSDSFLTARESHNNIRVYCNKK